MTTSSSNGPLHGRLVVDLSRALAGPHAAMMLADMGAGVIRVEAPSGDESRASGPPFVDPGDVERADALIDSFRPDVFDRLAFSVGKLFT